jgi:hypothetical protein
VPDGERELWCAVIHTAVKDALRPAPNWGKARGEAVVWLFQIENEEPLSFPYLCDVLGLDAYRIRMEVSRRTRGDTSDPLHSNRSHAYGKFGLARSLHAKAKRRELHT